MVAREVYLIFRHTKLKLCKKMHFHLRYPAERSPNTATKDSQRVFKFCIEYCRLICKHECFLLKEELKAKISNFSNIVFGKPNISKVKFVGLFLLVFCYFVRKLRSKLGFSLWFCLFSAGSKTKSAAFCDV